MMRNKGVVADQHKRYTHGKRLAKEQRQRSGTPYNYLLLSSMRFCTQENTFNGYCHYAALQATLLFLVNQKGMRRIGYCLLLSLHFSSQRR